MIDTCPICDEYIFFGEHKCQPCFYVWKTDGDEFVDIYDYKGHKIFAHDEEDAAVKFANNDWEFPDEQQVYVISVKEADDILNKDDCESGEFKQETLDEIEKSAKEFSIASEVVRSFYAREVEKID